MTSMLIRYYFQPMHTWLLCLPIGLVICTALFLLIEPSSNVYGISLLTTLGLITPIFLSFTRSYEKMIATMPISTESVVQSKFLFLFLVASVYFVLFTVFYFFIGHNESIASWVRAALSTFMLSILLINIFLLVELIRGKRLTYLYQAVTLFVVVAVFYQPYSISMLTQQLFSAISAPFFSLCFVCIITFINYKLCCRLMKKIDIS